MAKIVMIYASMTGNTEAMAEAFEEGIRTQEGVELTVKDILEAEASELETYDGILLGSYTWGEGELPDEFLDFYEDMDNLKFEGKKAAVFGSGDKDYAEFCHAVNILNDKLKELGADLVQEGLKVELTPNEEDLEKCRKLGEEFAKNFLK